MQAVDIMSPDVITVPPEASADHAAELLTKHQITQLPVVDHDGRLLGMVSEVDLLKDLMPVFAPRIARFASASNHRTSTTVGRLMTSPAVCMAPSSDIAYVASTMVHLNLHAVPIVDGPRIVGIISHKDVLRALLHDQVGPILA